MKSAMSISNPNPFVVPSYVVSIVAFATGTLAMPFDLRIAFLPIAFMCGWPQIGGL